MIDVPLLDELREIRRRLSEAVGCDAERYAATLDEIAKKSGAKYVTEPLLPEPSAPFETASKEAG